ncbi:hypothetical protein SPRG_16903 [Saprolegnia parasitica CBS 223.65]|uniref:Uncharacterized protein n=1 Tax=Saprolegnia parasitica (strain CBS 223.65) TaxID=695850 RepID=A0A067BKP0_SAPPC|nr:hypothetical protein SPRG_16903 [Saprolegnia parasitica CBS 223.65]KDO17275.1 hypothetical protein SPRG_16903 [Saprolegnia parasitica CBS 223.65]|eukprot:XP_012212017.1 hypothetical protein SPRG_16903 [Saprolegnia parasitica CBS 223.65]
MVAAHQSNIATKSTIAALEHASAVAEMRPQLPPRRGRSKAHASAAGVTVVEPNVAVLLVEAAPVVRASSAEPVLAIDSPMQKPLRKKTKQKPTKKKPKQGRILQLQMEAFEEEELQGFLVANGLKPGDALPSAFLGKFRQFFEKKGFAIDAAAYMDHISISLFSNNLAADLKKYCRPPGTFHVTTMEHKYVDPISGERMCVHAKRNGKSLAFRFYDPEARNKWRPLTKNTFKDGTQLRWIRRVLYVRNRTTDDE